MADPEGQVADVEGEGTSEEPTSEDLGSQGDGDARPAELASQLMQNPQVLAALQDKLGSMVGVSSGYIQSLPKVVKRRLKALKKIQFEATKIEAEFYREVHKLECDYAQRYGPLFEKRTTIVTGGYEPNDEEADWPSDKEDDDELSDEVKNKVNLEEKADEEKEKDKDGEKEETESKGVPGFWLTIFKNVDMLSEMIQPHDEAILNHLQDVKVIFSEKDPMGFTLEFHFEPNEHFANTMLTKQYTMRSEPDESDPFSFEGPEIVKCKGCKIDWKKGKNVTVKTVKKKQKHKGSGTTRTITKTVQSDSFFNFFSPPSPPDEEEMDEDTEALLAADFEIGHFIRERIVPRAVLYFTGEALENDDEYEDGEEEDGGEEGDYDEDADPDYNPALHAKYVTREFQDYCATLALGRNSTPSSAPNDTRITIRPKTAASANRKNIAVETDPWFRPTSAPSQPRSLVTDDLNKTTETSTDKKNTQKGTPKNDNYIQENNASNISNRPKTVTIHGRTHHSDNESKSRDKRTDSVKSDGSKTDQSPHTAKVVNQGIGSGSLQREFTLVEIPLAGKDQATLRKEKTYITDRADLQVKRSEKNATMRKSRLDALLEQTVELVEDALNNEGTEPSIISETVTIKDRRKPVPRSQSLDARRRPVDRKTDETLQRRRVEQARDKLRQQTKRRVEKQNNDPYARVRKPARRMVWNQNPGQAYVQDLQERGRQAYVRQSQERLRTGQKYQDRGRSGAQAKTRGEKSRDSRQFSAPPFVVPNPSSLRSQETSNLRRSKAGSTISDISSAKEQSRVQRSHSQTREARQRSSKSDRYEQPKYDTRMGSSVSVKSHQSQDSEMSRPVVMMIEGDDPSAYTHLQFDMTRTARSIDIANSIDFSGSASKLRGSPYLQNNPYVMGRPRKQRSASLNRSQHR